MGRRTNVSSLQVLTSAGVAVPDTDTAESGITGPGRKTLTATETYYIPLPGGEDANLLSLMSQWDAALLITSITIEETDAPERDVSWYAASAGNWFPTDEAKITSATNGAGTSTNTADVVAHTAGGAGGAIQNIQDSPARRHRAVVVVGATGGEARFFGWAKE